MPGVCGGKRRLGRDYRSRQFRRGAGQRERPGGGSGDLNLRLGDAALTLGLAGDFSTLDALENENRLDSDLVSKLLVRHSSGLKVLAAPEEHTTAEPAASAVMKLVQILRGRFSLARGGCRLAIRRLRSEPV